MKMSDLNEKENSMGTYAGVHFDNDTIKSIEKYIKDNDIPNGLTPDSLHTTLLYSRKFLPNYEPEGMYAQPMIGKPTGVEKWPSQPNDDGKVSMCLVLKYNCPQLVNRHEALMKKHDATYDYPEYKPHVTLSYDVGSLQVKDLQPFKDDLKIVKEYGEELDLNWKDNN